jgi:hypothetical protein
MSEESGLGSSGHPDVGLGTLILLFTPSSIEQCLLHYYCTVLMLNHFPLAPTLILTSD